MIHRGDMLLNCSDFQYKEKNINRNPVFFVGMKSICDFYMTRIGREETVLLIGPGMEEYIQSVGEAPARLPYDPNALFFATYLKSGNLLLFDRSVFDYGGLQNFFTLWQNLGTQLCSIRYIEGDIRLNENRNTALNRNETVVSDMTIIDHLTFSRHIAPYIIFDMDKGVYPPHVNIWDHFTQIYTGLLGKHSGKIIMHFQDSHWQITLRERMKKAFSDQGWNVEVIEDIEDIYHLDDEHIWEMVEKGMIESVRFNLETQQIVPAFSSKSILVVEHVSCSI